MHRFLILSTFLLWSSLSYALKPGSWKFDSSGQTQEIQGTHFVINIYGHQIPAVVQGTVIFINFFGHLIIGDVGEVPSLEAMPGLLVNGINAFLAHLAQENHTIAIPSGRTFPHVPAAQKDSAAIASESGASGTGQHHIAPVNNFFRHSVILSIMFYLIYLAGSHF